MGLAGGVFQESFVSVGTDATVMKMGIDSSVVDCRMATLGDGFPRLANEVQHLARVLPWENITDMSPLKSDVRLPVYVPRGTRYGRSLQLWIARHRQLLGRRGGLLGVFFEGHLGTKWDIGYFRRHRCRGSCRAIIDYMFVLVKWGMGVWQAHGSTSSP